MVCAVFGLMLLLGQRSSYTFFLSILLFSCTVAAYIILFILGRKWRSEFEAQGIKYWTVSKDERVRELMLDGWRMLSCASIPGLGDNGGGQRCFHMAYYAFD